MDDRRSVLAPFAAHYATKGVKTAYPFGFALSYTQFRYSGLKLSGAELQRQLTAGVRP